MSLGNPEGSILADRYRLVELVGTGAMGQVYRAEDELLGGVTVAIKFLAQTLLNDKMRQRFEREATISALLGEKSIHIIRVRDYGIDEREVPYYVMEFLEGQSLGEIIKFRPLPLPRFLHLTRQICVGMDAAHSGIMLHKELCKVVHRDIKPSNILIMEDATLGELVKILDFGIARLIQANAAQTRTFMGTLAYCSPEQMEGKELDNRSDIYSLGVMMYEMLTLEMPVMPESSSFGGWYKAHHEFEPRPLEQYAQFEIPPELKKIIMQCMAKSREDRPQKVMDILRVIDELEINLKNKGSEKTTFSAKKTIIAEPVAKENLLSKDKTEIVTDKLPAFPDNRLKTATTEQKLRWPTNKPIQKIVFPRIITTQTESFASLWVMLNKEDIKHRISSIRYNQFLFLSNPHPMILWITVIYNSTYGARWLPCYLDLKTDIGVQVTSTLARQGNYKILFFALEEPEFCLHSTISTIAPNQCSLMLEWVESSKIITSVGQATASKKRLKSEFDKLKGKILIKLQETATKKSLR